MQHGRLAISGGGLGTPAPGTTAFTLVESRNRSSGGLGRAARLLVFVLFALSAAASLGADRLSAAPPDKPLRVREGSLNAPTSSGGLWLEIMVCPPEAILRLHNTGANTNYFFFTREKLESGLWNLEAEGPGLPGQNTVSVTIPLNDRTRLFAVGGVGSDSDGDGLPDIYEALVTHTDPFNPDTRNRGMPDGQGDSDGDGWTDAEEFRNRQDPFKFDPPPPLIGLFKTTDLRQDNCIEWSSPSAQPTRFTIERKAGGAWQSLATVPGDVTSFTDTSLRPGMEAQYRVRAEHLAASGPFASTESAAAGTSEPSFTLQATVARGPGGRMFFVGAWDEIEEVTHRIRRRPVRSIHPKNYIFEATADYPRTYFTGAAEVVYTELPARESSDGPVRLSTDFLPYHGWYLLSFQQVGKDGRLGNPREGGAYFDATPYLDGREHLLENLHFALRAGASTRPFNFQFGQGPFSAGAAYGFFPSYAVGGFHWMRHVYSATFEVFDPYRPFEDNALFRNFCFEEEQFDSTGHPRNGLSDLGLPSLAHWHYNFNSGDYARAGSTPIPPTLLSGAASQYIFGRAGGDETDLSDLGMSWDASIPGWRMATAARNSYGLRYRSIRAVKINSSPGPLEVLTVQPGGALPSVGYLFAGEGAYFFTDAEPPVLSTLGFYFADPNLRDCPGSPTWTSAESTNEFLLGFGQRLTLAGWSKKGLKNGAPDRFGYLGLYFDKAYKLAPNGAVTTLETGILSEYGDFFGTEPGRVALTTKPDLTDGPAAACVVNVIKLELDVNHDGNMDGRYNGPDSTTEGRPFVFWVNDDYDRRHEIGCPFNCTFEEDDLDPAQDDLALRVPDHAYSYLLLPANVTVPGIPCRRDLEDYARLWTTGVEHLLPGLPVEGVVELAWRTTSPQNPTLRVFRAAETDGGTNYLANEEVAQQQLGFGLYQGLVAPGSALRLNAASLLPSTEKYIFCATSRGHGELVLRVRVGNAVLVETSAFIQTKGIKEMYERWTAGDSARVAPLPLARPASEDLPRGVAPFEYPYSHAQDTNKNYILFVHGWNLDRYQRDRFAETAFKRLYWQGYQGRFGSFRWPTWYNFPFRGLEGGGFDLDNFDNAEFQGWQSGQALRRLLTKLNNRYPGQVRLFAHSQGNIVAGEALRMATQPLVAVYAAMQAAVAVHDYDPLAPVRKIPLIYESGTPNLHANYWKPGDPSYFHVVPGASQFINFYNPMDWALGWWEVDQNMKPNGGCTYDRGRGEFAVREGASYRVLELPKDTYTLFAYCVESRCLALGAQAGAKGVFDPTGEVLLDPTFEFGDKQQGHSAQFRSTNMKRARFWNELMRIFKVRPK